MLETSDYRLRQRDYLLRISKAITAQLDLDTVLSLVIEYAVEIVAGTYGFIALANTTWDRLRIVASYNLPHESWSAFDPLLEALYRPEATVEDGAVAARSIAEALNLPLRQMVSLPLLVGQSTTGAIVVFRAAVNVAFTADDRRLLQAFADHAAVAVQNARLYQAAVGERERLNTIIEESADGVMIFDERWRITTFNRAMEQLTGWPREEAIGRPCAEVIGYRSVQGIDICLTDCPLQRLPRAEHPVAEGWITTREGRRRYLQTRYSPTWGPRGEFLGAIANVRDITRQKQEEEQQLTFISVISHELKTPVSIIKGYAGTLRRPDANWSTETVAEGLQVIEEEADRLSELIGNLLDVSRLQAGGLSLNLVPFDILPLVARMVQAIAATAPDKFTFELRFPPRFPLVVGDETRLQMVLSNLLTNAVKYSPGGGTIRVGGWAEGTQALIYVSDPGIGVPTEDRERIFERFYRADNTLTRETQGAGLGLYLARVIVEAHGGRIYAEAQPQGGTRFVFTLPLHRPQLVETPESLGVPPNEDRRPFVTEEHPMLLKDLLPPDIIEANIDHLNALFAQNGYHPDPGDLSNVEVPGELVEEIRADPGLLRYTEDHGRTSETGTGQ